MTTPQPLPLKLSNLVLGTLVIKMLFTTCGRTVDCGICQVERVLGARLVPPAVLCLFDYSTIELLIAIDMD